VSKNLVEVRNRFSKALNNPAHWGTSSRAIALAFLGSEGVSIPEPWREVTVMGLIQMMVGLRRRKPPAGTGGAWDLFAGCGLDPVVVIDEKNKGLPSLTLPEAQECLARQMKEHETDTKKIRAWRRLIRRAEPFMTRENMTLAEGLELAAKAAAKKKKKA
jgi:hypothetical protein